MLPIPKSCFCPNGWVLSRLLQFCWSFLPQNAVDCFLHVDGASIDDHPVDTGIVKFYVDHFTLDVPEDMRVVKFTPKECRDGKLQMCVIHICYKPPNCFLHVDGASIRDPPVGTGIVKFYER